MVKLLGAASVILGGLLCSAVAKDHYNNNLHQINSYIKLIEVVLNSIKHYSLPVGEILSRCDSDTIKGCVGRSVKIGSFSGLCEETSFLSVELEQIVNDLSEKIGKGYLDEQVKLCEGSLEKLKKLRLEQEKKTASKIAVSRAVLLGVSAVTVIILI